MDTTQITPGSVVVGVDGSQDSLRAVAWAAAQAAGERRELVLVHGADPGILMSDPSWLAIAGIDADQISQALAESSRERLGEAVELARRTAPEVSCTVRAVSADARVALLDLSAVADLVVVGSRGLGPLRTPVLGSVSAAVARRARCPVVVCRPRRGEGSGDGRVVVGSDGSRAARSALELAFRQASLRKADLTVVHCFWDVSVARHGPGLVEPGGPGDPVELRVMLAESVAGLSEEHPDVRVDVELWRGLVDDALTRAARDCELLVVGRPDPSQGTFLQMSSALAVLERAHTTVVVVPEPAAAEQH